MFKLYVTLHNYCIPLIYIIFPEKFEESHEKTKNLVDNELFFYYNLKLNNQNFYIIFHDIYLHVIFGPDIH